MTMVESSSAPRKPPMVDCPTCRAATPYEPGNPWRPFCSERCREVDLGAWASERYRVGGGVESGGESGDDAVSSDDA
jgi:uncharacterized protein